MTELHQRSVRSAFRAIDYRCGTGTSNCADVRVAELQIITTSVPPTIPVGYSDPRNHGLTNVCNMSGHE